MSKKFLTVIIRSTPLVKAFLENNFGNPVTIPERHILNKLACAQLFKENNRWEGDWIEYSEKIDLNIGTKNFRFDGFNVNKANTCNFNNAVRDFIGVLCCSNIETLISLYDKQIDWKARYINLVHSKGPVTTREAVEIKKELNKELRDFEFTKRKAIEYVVTTILKLDFEILPFETVKKEFYRFEKKEKKIKI